MRWFRKRCGGSPGDEGGAPADERKKVHAANVGK
jgi:hypothetical protein